MKWYVAIVDMARATNTIEAGHKRPCVVCSDDGNTLSVYKITTRNKDDKYHCRMNTYKVSGFCDVGICYKIDKKYLVSFKRPCTVSEIQGIMKKSSVTSYRDFRGQGKHDKRKKKKI